MTAPRILQRRSSATTDERAEVVAGCRWLGAEIDPARNAACECDIGAATSRVKVMMIPTNEELNIAKSTIALVSSKTRQTGEVP